MHIFIKPITEVSPERENYVSPSLQFSDETSLKFRVKNERKRRPRANGPVGNKGLHLLLDANIGFLKYFVPESKLFAPSSSVTNGNTSVFG
jgi:hypothetical protein